MADLDPCNEELDSGTRILVKFLIMCGPPLGWHSLSEVMTKLVDSMINLFQLLVNWQKTQFWGKKSKKIWFLDIFEN